MGPDQSYIRIINSELENYTLRWGIFIASFHCNIYLNEITRSVIKPRQFTKSNF